MHYITQSKRVFTNRGSIMINWQGDNKPFYAEVIYNTKANITIDEMASDVKQFSVPVIDLIRKFIPNLEWNSLEEMKFNGKQGSIIIYK